MNIKKITSYLENCRWCNFKEGIRGDRVMDISFEKLPYDNGQKLFVIGEVKLQDGTVRYFSMPLARQKQMPENKDVKPLVMDGEIYTDALLEKDFWQSFMGLVNEHNGVVCFPNGWKLIRHNIGNGTKEIDTNSDEPSKALSVEQSNTTLNVGNGKLAFKLERMLEFSTEINSELEMNEKLMREHCEVMPKSFGCFIWQMPDGRTASSGIVQEFVQNKGDMWNYLQAVLDERLHTNYLIGEPIYAEDCSEFLEMFRNLSLKTREMGECLGRDDDNPHFSPEKVDEGFIRRYQKQFQVLCYQAKRNIKNNIDRLPLDTRVQAQKILETWDESTSFFINTRLEAIRASQDKGTLNRVHGDFHLGQVMVTPENDLRFIDFAGEPGLSMAERLQKHLSVRDVAGMYRSIKGYLGAVAVEEFAKISDDPECAQKRKNWASKSIKPLIDEAAKIFLGDKSLKTDHWLALEVLRKNFYEIDYELNNRPEMAYIPISGLTELLGSGNGGIANDNFKKGKAAGYDL